MKKDLLFLLALFLLAMTTNLHSQTWNEVMKTAASDRSAEDYYGGSVSISGHFAIVGAYHESEDENDENTLLWAGSAYILEKDDQGYWNQVQKIVASDRDSQDHFGNAVSISGNYAIVGAYFESEDASGENSLLTAGSAYIFERDGSGAWNQVQKIVSSERDYGVKFGNAVDISGDYAIVGEYQAGGNGKHGAAYIFKRDDQGVWTELKKLTVDYVAPYARFGLSVSIDQNYCIVGSNEDEVDENGVQVNQGAGAAYVFENDGSTWSQVSKLVAPVRRKNAHFGVSVGVSGNYAIVGAEWETHDEVEADSLGIAGAAYLFERDGSANWDLVQKIVPSDRALTDIFGNSVSISGSMAVVGAYFKSEIYNEIYYGQIGASYIFSRNGSGQWEEMTKLSASDGSMSDNFGWSVDIAGNYAIIGAWTDKDDALGENPLSSAGSAYVFSYCSTVEKNDPVTICKGDSVLLGGKYQLESGTFYDTLRASTGCDSVIISELSVNEVDTELTTTETTLTAQAASGSYQWIDCSSNQNIQGETNQSFTPTSSGTYAVELTQNGCKDTSICYTFTMVGIEDLELEGSVKVYPNPANNLLNIELEEMYEFIHIRILNVQGKEVIQKQFENEQLLRINLSELPAGPYFIHMQTPKGNASIRVVKNE